MGKSTCVTFAAYQSARWKCHRYEVDGSHSYGHYFYTSEIAYHTIDGVDSYCIEPNTTSLGGQYYTSYTADEASSSSYWKLELDDLQQSHIQKILAFGYPQVDYGYSRQVQYAATQVLIWEVVSHSRYNTDIKSCTDYGLYRNVYAVLGADFQSCYDGILNAISVSDGTVPSFAGTSQSSAKSITLWRKSKHWTAARACSSPTTTPRPWSGSCPFCNRYPGCTKAKMRIPENNRGAHF